MSFLLSALLNLALLIGLAVLALVACAVILIGAGAFIVWCDERERQRRMRVTVERVDALERKVTSLVEYRRSRVIPIGRSA